MGRSYYVKDIETYLDSNGKLTQQQCLALCDFIQQQEYIGNVLEIRDCRDDGTNADGNQLLYCKS